MGVHYEFKRCGVKEQADATMCLESNLMQLVCRKMVESAVQILLETCWPLHFVSLTDILALIDAGQEHHILACELVTSNY